MVFTATNTNKSTMTAGTPTLSARYIHTEGGSIICTQDNKPLETEANREFNNVTKS